MIYPQNKIVCYNLAYSIYCFMNNSGDKNNPSNK